MARVLVAEPIARAGLDLLRARHDVEVLDHAGRPGLLAAVTAADALVVRSETLVDAETLRAGTHLKVVGRAGIGLDNVDVQAATRQGVLVVNAPLSNVMSAAEHALALLLALVRNIPRADAALRAGRWERGAFQGTELFGKTAGVVGFGRVGTLVAQRLNAFGMQVIAYDPYVSAERASQFGVDLVDLDDLLGKSDIVTIHLPRTAETAGLFSAERLARCKAGARLVNTARGGIVDEHALAASLVSGHLAGVALDVFATEPATASPLFGLPNVVVTPHLGASTTEAQDRAGLTIAEQVLLALDGEFVPFAVNVNAGPVPDAVRGYVPLVERLGELFVGLAKCGPTSGLRLTYIGGLADQDTRVLALGALKGVLTPVLDEPVTFVNASQLAADHGITVTETRQPQSQGYMNVVELTGDGPRGPISVAGTTIGTNAAERIVTINGFELDVAPTEHMAFLSYEDRPGVIGRVGTLLGEADVNIAGMRVGRRSAGGEALMVLTLDAPIPAEVLAEVVAAVGASDGICLRLGVTS